MAPFHEGHERRYPLARIAADVAARLTRGTLSAVYADRNRVKTLTGDELRYDALVVAVGARPVATVPASCCSSAV
jgi:NADH dehydrogenase FAD-containing subunit